MCFLKMLPLLCVVDADCDEKLFMVLFIVVLILLIMITIVYVVVLVKAYKKWLTARGMLVVLVFSA